MLGKTTHPIKALFGEHVVWRCTKCSFTTTKGVEFGKHVCDSKPLTP
jgi:hypothetical protein